ncbi:MAG: tRNA 5-methoxyuridine(34)/uridine 5-oxyacetic acid(34) synthase CmoB [Halothiobacillus sp.]|jgi:tRNA (mo5U34)-methyltransferase|nr:tRNA 5-methoxyuridine(34)/uridine 5-oxyacetic acid(34) synthase CmoB [Halothiobacillus sp.]
MEPNTIKGRFLAMASTTMGAHGDADGDKAAFSQWLIAHAARFDDINHGHWEEWSQVVAQLPAIPAERVVTLDQPVVSVRASDVESENRKVVKESLERQLRQLSPWRKGPFSLYDVFIDTEWRSDFKWQRLQAHISPLDGKKILDVGTGSGYHLWRMLGDGAAIAVGVEPTLSFVAQFYAVAHLLGERRAVIIPTTLENLSRAPLFDTVFSMGVLYHRRNPLGHIQELAECLKPGGELVLETLVIEGDAQQVLTPTDRYAGMRNIWFIPSVPLLCVWLARLGFESIRLVNQESTSLDEQRATDWTDFKPSLADFLDPVDRSKTIEGHPAPLRAILTAKKVNRS